MKHPLLALLCVALVGCASPPTSLPTSSPTSLPAQTTAPTLAPTRCPQATPEVFRVEPVQSPSSDTQQVISVRIGLGEQVTVETETGLFTANGDFSAFSQPVLVTITLKPETVHKLKVTARVREVVQNGCKYGGYVLSTERDRNGSPLLIEQRATAVAVIITPTVPTALTATVVVIADSAPTRVAPTAIVAVPTIAPSPSAIPKPSIVPTAIVAVPTPAPSTTPIPQPTAVPQAACVSVAYNDLIASPARPAALAALPAQACVMVVYKAGEQTRHTWYPVGSRLRLGYIMYVRLPTNQVTVFTKDNVPMAREFIKGRKAEDLPLKREGGQLRLNASGTAIFAELGGNEYQALVDVLVRQ